MNNKKGISLITLVVTIIILLILAAITIGLMIGKDSTTSKAIDSKIDGRYATIIDKVKIRENELFIAGYRKQGGTTAQEFVENLIDKEYLILSEDAYEPDYSIIYIGKKKDGTYKYQIEIKELDQEDNTEGLIIFRFKLNGGNIGGSIADVIISGEYGELSSTPETPNRTNYTFDGWSPSVPATFDSNKTFTAQWTLVAPTNYTFTFQLNGGSIGGSTADRTTSGTAGSPSSTPGTPTRDNYEFTGWNPSVPNTFDGNKTFIAQWTVTTYTFTFQLNGGNIGGSIANQTTSGIAGSPSSTPETPNRMGFEFNGWNPSVPATFDGNRTFFAKWTAITYTFIFHLNEGNQDGSTALIVRSGLYGDEVDIPTNITRENYTFAGWSPFVPSTFDDNRTFMAQWTPVTYTFTFQLNGGRIGGSTEDQTTSGLYGTTSSTPGTPTRTHYEFDGWSPSVPNTFDGNKTFTAQWTAATYTFTFQLNGGRIGGSTEDQITSGLYGSTSSTPGTPTRIHYEFDGWSPTVPNTFDGNKTFTAQWTAATYTFTFQLNGGRIGGSTEDQTTSGLYGTTSSTPGTPTRTHYEFDGWSPSVPATFDSNKTFTAQWTLVAPTNYTFTFQLNGGSIGGSTEDRTTSGASGTTSSIPGTPTRENYTFDGWSPSVPSTFDGNKVFTAQWSVPIYTFTFNLNGGNRGGSTANIVINGAYGSTVTIPTDIVKAGYVLIGWTPEVPSIIDGNKTFTAIWSCPMEIEVRKATAEEQVLIPITFNSGDFALISIDNDTPVEYTTDNPLLIINKPVGTSINIKIIGRIDAFNYYGKSETYQNQMHKLIKWGELNVEYIGFFACQNLQGPIPSPEPNSFLEVTTFDSTFSWCTGLTGNIPIGLFDNCPKATNFAFTFE